MSERGVVLRHEGSAVIVDLGGEEVRCNVRKGLRHAAGARGKVVVVGDRVEVERGVDETKGAAVVSIEPRTSQISRPDPGDPRRELVLVSNLDTLLVVASTRQPDLVPGLVDRFLAAAQLRELEAALVVNKSDLDPRGDFRETARIYEGLGYAVIETSAETGAGLEELRLFLKDRTTAMLGHSGVGKSALANALDPALDLRTAEVHDRSGLGVHTTTTVSLLRLPWGGYLVDTPGIREFGLWDTEPRDLTYGFVEFAERAQDCRFNDCLHEQEPGCAIKTAVEAGQISAARYDSYLRILESLRER